MGVPGLFGWLAKRFPKIIRYLNRKRLALWALDTVEVLSLSIDMNSLFHKCAQRIFLYGEFEGADPKRQEELKSLSDKDLEDLLIVEIGKELASIIKTVRPQHTLILAVDGPAPIAKL